MKNTIITIIAVILIGIGIYILVKSSPSAPGTPNQNGTAATTQNTGNVDNTQTNGTEVIGKSREGRDIIAYHYSAEGTTEANVGETREILFVGGIHGGYEWNTAIVAYNLMDYLKQHPEVIPQNVRVAVIPVLNPDGLNKVVGTTSPFTAANVTASESVQIAGRFNGNNVDLNRNFDCDWQAEGVWQNRKVSGGSAAFSEPESQAIKNYIESRAPAAVVAWYSAAGGVYSSSCHNGVSAETGALTETYAKVSGYPAYKDFDFYAITGDMTNWLAKQSIPAISVLLTTHQDAEWSKNKAGVEALLKYYSK